MVAMKRIDERMSAKDRNQPAGLCHGYEDSNFSVHRCREEMVWDICVLWDRQVKCIGQLGIWVYGAWVSHINTRHQGFHCLRERCKRGAFCGGYNPSYRIYSQTLGKRWIDCVISSSISAISILSPQATGRFKPNHSQRCRNFFRACLSQGSECSWDFGVETQAFLYCLSICPSSLL